MCNCIKRGMRMLCHSKGVSREVHVGLMYAIECVIDPQVIAVHWLIDSHIH